MGLIKLWKSETALVTVLLLVTALSLFTAVHFASLAPSTNYLANETTQHQSPQTGEKETWWERLWSDPVATFTMALFIATGGLWIATYRLWRSTKDAVRDAKDSSDRAFFAQHRPRLRVRRITVEAWKTENPMKAHIDIANIGDSVATVISIGSDIFPRDPSFAFDARAVRLPEPRFVEPGEQISFNVASKRGLTYQENWDIEAGTLDLCFLGIVHYLDGNGTRRLTSYFRIFDFRKSRFKRADPDDEYADWEYED